MYTNPKTGKREPDENFFTKLIVFLINGNYDSATKNEFNKPGGTYAQLQEYLADMPKNIPAADLQGGNGVVAPAANAGVKKK
jgi:site-specific DNA-adenine methylase